MAKKEKTIESKTKKAVKAVKTEKVVKAAKANKLGRFISSSKGSVTDKLRNWNLGIALILALEALAIAAFSKSLSLPITTQYLSVDKLASEANGHQVLATATTHLVDVPMVWAVVVLLLLWAGAYAMAATVYRKRWESTLQRGVVEARWATYGVAGGAMVVVIAMLSGIHQLSSLLMLFALMVVGCFSIWAAEMLKVDKYKGVLSHVICGLGLACVLAPWVVLAIGVGGALMYDGTVPAYLYCIYATMTLFLLAFTLLTHYRMIRKGRWTDSYRAEKTYMLLGLGAVTVLAWQIFAGVL